MLHEWMAVGTDEHCYSDLRDACCFGKVQNPRMALYLSTGHRSSLLFEGEPHDERGLSRVPDEYEQPKLQRVGRRVGRYH